MYYWAGTYHWNLSAIGLGDELQFDYEPKSGKIRVSVFQNGHWQDAAEIDITELFSEKDKA